MPIGKDPATPIQPTQHHAQIEAANRRTRLRILIMELDANRPDTTGQKDKDELFREFRLAFDEVVGITQKAPHVTVRNKILNTIIGSGIVKNTNFEITGKISKRVYEDPLLQAMIECFIMTGPNGPIRVFSNRLKALEDAISQADIVPGKEGYAQRLVCSVAELGMYKFLISAPTVYSPGSVLELLKILVTLQEKYKLVPSEELLHYIKGHFLTSYIKVPKHPGL